MKFCVEISTRYYMYIFSSNMHERFCRFNPTLRNRVEFGRELLTQEISIFMCGSSYPDESITIILEIE